MVTVSSNINIYSNLSANERISGFVKDNLFIGELPQNSTNINSDKFEKNTYNPNSSYSDKIQTKTKTNNQDKANTNEKTPEEKKEIENLQKTDQKVRAHEQAHLAAGAGLVRGGASFEYTRGPDGKMYAVGGEVKIDISPVSGKPDETIRKMQRVIAAALAPVDPSPQDRAVATIARSIQSKAQMEKSEEARKSTQKNDSSQKFEPINNTTKTENEEQVERTNEQKNDKINRKQVIKQYIINNPYQNLDRILFKSV